MRKYFKGVNDKDADGWLLATCGCSNIDSNDYVIDTNSLHGDEVPPCCSDAMLFSQFVSGLLNCYYNNLETKNLSEKQIIALGIVEEEEKIPHPDNPELPF